MMSNRFDSTQAFQEFISLELQHAQGSFQDRKAAVYIYCQVNNPDVPGRRVLAVAEAYSPKIEVSVEAAYQVFDGDTHYVVREIGAVERFQAAGQLLPLVLEAYETATTWKPTFSDIGEYLYLPG
jgi:hypothetical protein